MMHWVKTPIDQLPPVPVPDEVNHAELNESFTLAGKKNEVYIMTVDRDPHDCHTSCMAGWEM
ncbi:MAG TPA: hypothetical protein VHL11_00605 [Phototrophicaceae bacterium]|nr:hypothetical protein [Phototrophicaceae bacterium]